MTQTTEQDTHEVPYIVEPGWTRSEVIRVLAAPSYRLLHYPDGTVRFEHRCDRGDRGVIICAPALRLGHGHTLTYDEHGEKPTVRPSVFCDDCDTHGWITSGWWKDAG